jgi:hypothetical protein
VKPYLSGGPAGIKVTSHRIFQLVLKLPQILALRCYATIPRRIIPGSYKDPRFLGYPYLKYDFVHVLHITAALAEGQRTAGEFFFGPVACVRGLGMVALGFTRKAKRIYCETHRKRRKRIARTTYPGPSREPEDVEDLLDDTPDRPISNARCICRIRDFVLCSRPREPPIGLRLRCGRESAPRLQIAGCEWCFQALTCLNRKSKPLGRLVGFRA